MTNSPAGTGRPAHTAAGFSLLSLCSPHSQLQPNQLVVVQQDRCRCLLGPVPCPPSPRPPCQPCVSPAQAGAAPEAPAVLRECVCTVSCTGSTGGRGTELVSAHWSVLEVAAARPEPAQGPLATQHAIHKATYKGNQNYKTRSFLWSNTGDFCVPSFLNQTCEEIPAGDRGPEAGTRRGSPTAPAQAPPRVSSLGASPRGHSLPAGSACVCALTLPQPDSEKGVEGTSSEGRAGGLQSPGLANGSRYSR